MRSGKLLALAGMLAGLTALPQATGNTSSVQVEQQVPRNKEEHERPQVQRERRRSPAGFREARICGPANRYLNQRQRRKLHRQVPQLLRKKHK
jgi:hypothetical protein